ncbi:MAG: S1 RNA-binding domain-containing protein, partial [bacterium]
IMGIEDFNGDMDFKIAGTEKGITAVQLDVKIRGINEEILKDTVKTAREARLEILKEMKKTIRQPRDHVSKYAPKVDRFEIPKKKIGAVIGPGGKIIRQIIAEYNVEIDVEDDGTVTVSGLERENVDKASDYIKGMTREFRPGDKFTGTVKRIVPFGAFVEIFPGREGLVHISKMAKKYVSDPNNIVSEGDDVEVKIREIDDENRINLTMLMDEKIYPHRGSSRRPPSRKSRRPYPSRKSNRPRTRNDY